MSILELLKRDVLFYRKSHLGLILLAAVCCAVLTGAMLVGDSVQHTLLQIAELRLGKIQHVMMTDDRFFRQQLASDLQQMTDLSAAAVLAMKGVLESPDGSLRINQVNVYGVNEQFWQFTSDADTVELTNGIWISRSVASRLGPQPIELLLRIRKVSGLSQDLIFSGQGVALTAWPIEIAGVVDDQQLGRFDVSASQTPPLNVFVPIHWLAEKAEVTGKANMLLVGSTDQATDDVSTVLKEIIQPEDLGLNIHFIQSENIIELRTSRIFLDKPIAEAAMETGSGAVGVFTYFVNEIRCGEKTVPYSTVSAMDSKTHPTLLSDLSPDQIVINEWLADELNADVGDPIELIFFQISPIRSLIEQSSHFTVTQVVPLMGSFADKTLMPDYPGLTEADSCSDWESGIPIDLDRIESRDEGYWDKYKGTPKAFISLESAQNIWSNRFGSLTAVRFPTSDNSIDSIRSGLCEHLDPATVGFVFKDVQEAAESATAGSTDFAGLFGGLSMFLIISAAILLALVFAFYVESRSSQVGLLLAVGWGWLKILGFFLLEGAILALAGCIIGAAGSVIYTYMLIMSLNGTFWGKALADLHLIFHVGPLALVEGIVSSLIICVFAIQISLFHRIRRPVHQLLVGIFEHYGRSGKYRHSFAMWGGWLCLIAGVWITMTAKGVQQQVASFFASGSLGLIGMILIAAGILKWLGHRSSSFVDSIKRLGIKSIPRRTGRSLTVLITLACGVFMVVSVGANYKDVGAQAHLRGSGTGGFALLAQTTLPVSSSVELINDDLSITAGAVVQMRLYQKDDASCLNLNRSQEPSILGVVPVEFARRNAFTFQKNADIQQGQSAWQLLDVQLEGDAIPAIGDYATIFWALGKNLGDTIPYMDQNGNTINLKIVGILKDSLLQGHLFISEKHFVRHFPSIDGYQQFLIDPGASDLQQQAGQLTKAYRDYGMEVIPAAQKLAQYHEVENTYLAIFLVLGGLGLILGSAGLGLVLALNVWDRRGELAMMQAVGFRKPDLTKMLYTEHSLLLTAGLFCGTVPALWAVFPSILLQGTAFPYVKILLIIVGIFISGLIWIRLAAHMALRADFLDILKSE